MEDTGCFPAAFKLRTNQYIVLILSIVLQGIVAQAQYQADIMPEEWNSFAKSECSRRDTSQVDPKVESENRYNFDCCGCKGCGGLKAKVLIGLDTRQSYVLGHRQQMNGLRLGLEFNRHYRVGIAYYNLKDPVLISPSLVDGRKMHYSVNYKYSTLFYEYVLYEDYKWEISLPLTIGTGVATLTEWDDFGYSKVQESPGMSVVTASISGHYKFLRWLGLGAGGGYRLVLAREKQLKQAFNAPFYAIKIKIFIGEAVKFIFKRHQFDEERADHIEERDIHREEHHLHREERQHFRETKHAERHSHKTQTRQDRHGTKAHMKHEDHTKKPAQQDGSAPGGN